MPCPAFGYQIRGRLVPWAEMVIAPRQRSGIRPVLHCGWRVSAAGSPPAGRPGLRVRRGLYLELKWLSGWPRVAQRVGTGSWVGSPSRGLGCRGETSSSAGLRSPHCSALASRGERCLSSPRLHGRASWGRERRGIPMMRSGIPKKRTRCRHRGTRSKSTYNM